VPFGEEGEREEIRRNRRVVTPADSRDPEKEALETVECQEISSDVGSQMER